MYMAIASPCPGFNRGKNVPGGGRSSRSPPYGTFLQAKDEFDKLNHKPYVNVATLVARHS